MPATAATQISAEAIGETAGAIWQFLERNGRSPLSAVEQQVRAPKPLIQMGIGWLAREGKIGLAAQGRRTALWLT